MKKFRIFIFIIIISFAFNQSIKAEEKFFHFIENGEVLTRIARVSMGRSAYGKHGALVEIMKLNPNIKDPNKIFVGQRIRVLGKEQTKRLPASELVAITPSPVSIQAQPVVDPFEIEVDPFSPVSHLWNESGFEFFKIDATDKSSGSTTTILSNLNPQTRISWELDWSKKWSSILRFNYQSEKIQDNTSANQVTIKDTSPKHYGVESGITGNWSDSSRTSALLGFEDRLFVRASTPTSLTIDHVSSPILKIKQEQDFVHFKSVRLGASAAGEFIFPGTGPGYKTQTGNGAEFSLYMSHEIKDLTIKGSIHYGFSKQSSNLVDQKEASAGALFGISWKFGE